MKNRNNIFLIGPMGSGKSTVGKHLAQLLNYPFIDSDIEIERRTGVSISWIFEIEQEQGFRLRESQMIAEIVQRDHIVLATGGGVVITPNNRDLLAANGIVVYLTVSLATQLLRTKHSKQTRPLLNCADAEERLLTLNQQRTPFYQSIADLTYNTEEFTPSRLALQIKHDIQAPHEQ